MANIKKNRKEQQNATNAFSLEEVIEIIRQGAKSENEIAEIRLRISNDKIKRLNDCLSAIHEDYIKMSKKWLRLCYTHYEHELSTFRKEWLNYDKQVNKQLHEIAIKCNQARIRLREGLSTKDEHINAMKDLNSQRKELEEIRSNYYRKEIERLMEHTKLSEEQIRRYLYKI